MNRLARLLLGLGAPLLAAAACLYIRSGERRLLCAFYELTGLYCPGCGSGRAVEALLRGELQRALSCNALLLLLGLPAGALFLGEYLRLVFPRLGLEALALPRAAGRCCLVLVVGFWVLRNLPAFAFLAPA